MMKRIGLVVVTVATVLSLARCSTMPSGGDGGTAGSGGSGGTAGTGGGTAGTGGGTAGTGGGTAGTGGGTAGTGGGTAGTGGMDAGTTTCATACAALTTRGCAPTNCVASCTQQAAEFAPGALRAECAPAMATYLSCLGGTSCLEDGGTNFPACATQSQALNDCADPSCATSCARMALTACPMPNCVAQCMSYRMIAEQANCYSEFTAYRDCAHFDGGYACRPNDGGVFASRCQTQETALSTCVSNAADGGGSDGGACQSVLYGSCVLPDSNCVEATGEDYPGAQQFSQSSCLDGGGVYTASMPCSPMGSVGSCIQPGPDSDAGCMQSVRFVYGADAGRTAMEVQADCMDGGGLFQP